MCFIFNSADMEVLRYWNAKVHVWKKLHLHVENPVLTSSNHSFFLKPSVTTSAATAAAAP